MYVYILRSISNENQRYVGITEDLKQRLEKHNSGQVPHTSKFLPWKIIVAIWFEERNKAFGFEKYLKTGSGLAFRNRHF